MRWHLSDRADPRAASIADRHYNRQKIGSPQFVPPGRCLVLLTEQADALWITSWPFAEFVRHAWAGAWVCSCFRNESSSLSSELIAEAVAATRWRWADTPALGMITFVDPTKIRERPDWGLKKPDWGRCYRKAGFSHVGYTHGGLVALQLLPGAMPEACMPHGARAKSIELARHVGTAELFEEVAQ